jgi:nicotinamidase/pyrazinamidase
VILDPMYTAVVIVDEQYDFMPGGSLAVPDGDEVVAPTNAIAKHFYDAGGFTVRTRDWHPADTVHFAAKGGPWPPHCVVDTHGAAFHAGLWDIGPVVSKGTLVTENGGYSGFEGEIFDLKLTLEQYLRALDVQYVIVVGLATEYCVKATALDSAKLGFDTFVIPEACRGIDGADEVAAFNSLLLHGVNLMSIETLLKV